LENQKYSSPICFGCFAPSNPGWRFCPWEPNTC
jgi:hypothetical protein